MKKYLPLLIALLFLIACKKENSRPLEIYPDYLGTYNGSLQDTSYVTAVSNGIAQIRWVAKSGTTITFDSVLVASDLSFTDNEITDIGAQSFGTGYFQPNKIYFKFILDNGNATLTFNGIKH